VSETVDKRRQAELRSLLRAIEEAGWEYARVEIDGVSLVVSSDPEFADAAATAPTAPALEPNPAAAPAPPLAPDQAVRPLTSLPPTGDPPATEDGPVETVVSPTIGLFWRSPKPGAPPFVEVGDSVSAGETLCIIEVMKLMTHVTAPVDGAVRAIRIDNGSMVEHGTALVDIVRSDGGEASP
jgi:acetyl-CoA carboxylase biotin carboxyl carrier protein